MKKMSIQINKDTLDRLDMLKSTDNQSYDDILNNLIDNQEKEPLSEEELKDIEKGLEDIKRGRVKSIEQVAKELGIKLKQ